MFLKEYYLIIIIEVKGVFWLLANLNLHETKRPISQKVPDSWDLPGLHVWMAHGQGQWCGD